MAAIYRTSAILLHRIELDKLLEIAVLEMVSNAKKYVLV